MPRCLDGHRRLASKHTWAKWVAVWNGPAKVVAGGCFELYSNYALKIQAVAASIATTGPFILQCG